MANPPQGGNKPNQAAAERAARDRFDRAMVEVKEGAYKFSSRARGQAGVILDELIDPDGESVLSLADVEGDAGALALAMPIDLITFETWLLGQFGDADDLDLDIAAHRELWLTFAAWIGEALRTRHGGHWLIAGDDPRGWRLGFSKILLEIAPYVFAEALLRLGNGCGKKMVSELERLRALHTDQEERDGGKAIDRFTPQHYLRLHTVPLGQWLVVDLALLQRLWAQAPARELTAEVRTNAKRLGPANSGVIDKVLEVVAKLDPDKPPAAQTTDRGLFEAVGQIVALRRAAPPLAIDVLEKMVMPAMHMGIPPQFPPLGEDDLGNLRNGIELFALFVDMVPFKHPGDDGGFLGLIPRDDLSTPYPDRGNLEIGKGDWVIVQTKRFKEMLLEFDAQRLLDKYDEFVAYLAADPRAPRRRDNGRMLAETVARALADLKACVVAASSKPEHRLMFRILPPPG